MSRVPGKLPKEPVLPQALATEKVWASLRPGPLSMTSAFLFRHLTSSLLSLSLWLLLSPLNEPGHDNLLSSGQHLTLGALAFGCLVRWMQDALVESV